jgi:predicted ester cyclase
MRLTPPSGIMDSADSPQRKTQPPRRNFYVGRAEHGTGPPLHGGTSSQQRLERRGPDAGPNFINHNKLVPGQELDREDYLRGIAAFHGALSPGRLIIEDQVAAGDKVVTRFIVHAIHDGGELMGVAPTGREMTNRVILIRRICEGKIAEEWGMGTIGGTLRKRRR